MRSKSFVFRFLFYFLVTFLLASTLYYLIQLIFFPFGGIVLFDTFWGSYPHDNPLAYIAIPCFFYSLLAAAFHKYKKTPITSSVIWCTGLILVTSLFTSLVGGILWHIHDMMAGYFPRDWVNVLFTTGVRRGLIWGWGMLFITTIPYNIIGIIVCCKLTLHADKYYVFLITKATGIRGRL